MMGFPFAPHNGEAMEDLSARRWMHWRPPGGPHEWVAITTPAALLTWVHTNVQIVTTDQIPSAALHTRLVGLSEAAIAHAARAAWSS